MGGIVSNLVIYVDSLVNLVAYLDSLGSNLVANLEGVKNLVTY